MNIKKYCRNGLMLILLAWLPLAQADISGFWKTFDDHTGQAKSIVEIFSREDGQYTGKVHELLLDPPDSICEECRGERRNQPVVGMTIITGLEKNGDEYSGGTILDPENGREYRARLWLEKENTLKVRGYLAFLFRTQSWQRVEAP